MLITKTCLYNFEPLKPHFYIVKLGFIGMYIIFLISAENIDCGYPLELPHRCFQQKYEKYQNFLSENFHFLVVKFSVYLNRCVFVMWKHTKHLNTNKFLISQLIFIFAPICLFSKAKYFKAYNEFNGHFPLTHFCLETPKRVINKQYRPRSEATMQHLIGVFTVCKYFSHFSLGISKSHSLAYLKLKLDSSNI